MGDLTVREERLFADYSVPILAGPEYPDDVVSGPVGKASRPKPAANAPSGAMVALIPTGADAARLVVDGGEPEAELHTTVAYLGKAADIPSIVRDQIVSAVQGAVEDAILPDFDIPVPADAFAVSMFNPGGDDPCIVLGLSGKSLTSIRNIVIDTLGEVDGFDLPKQHETYVPHVTLVYTDDATRLADLTDRTGPVTFDRIRIAFAGEAVDIPLATPSQPTVLPAEPALGPSNTAYEAVPDSDVARLRPIRAFTMPWGPNR